MPPAGRTQSRIWLGTRIEHRKEPVAIAIGKPDMLVTGVLGQHPPGRFRKNCGGKVSKRAILDQCRPFNFLFFRG